MHSVHALAMQTHMLHLTVFQPAHLTVQFPFPTDPVPTVCHYLRLTHCISVFPIVIQCMHSWDSLYLCAELPLMLP